LSATLKRERIVAKGTGPRPPHTADFIYFGELALQCKFALSAYGEIRALVESGSTSLAILAYCHMMLVFAGNAAKLILHSSKSGHRAKARAQRLRRRLSLTGTERPEFVAARNYLEHFDERMDRFLSSHQGLLAHRLVAPVVDSEVTLDDGRTFRAAYLQAFETSTLTFHLYDHSVSLPALATFLQSLEQSASEQESLEVASGQSAP
jgi:hypothetical protein